MVAGSAVGSELASFRALQGLDSSLHAEAQMEAGTQREPPRSITKRARVPMLAAAATFAFTWAYGEASDTAPELSAVGMFYLLIGGLLWGGSKLRDKVKRRVR